MCIEIPNMVFGSNILHLRKKYRLSRTGLSGLTGISNYRLRDWEEKTDPVILTWEEMKRLMVIFQVSGEELVYADLAERKTP